MTESVPIACIREGELRAGSVGPAMDAVDDAWTDLSGNVLPDGQVGELQVQSPANCVGYWDDPQATAATFDEGWLRTGDLVRRDADGFYWFEGRVKQIIIRGGSNISPQEVEEALYHHPAVLEAGVIGMPDPVHGEKVIAFVALREGLTCRRTGATGSGAKPHCRLQDPRARSISAGAAQGAHRQGAASRVEGYGDDVPGNGAGRRLLTDP